MIKNKYVAIEELHARNYSIAIKNLIEEKKLSTIEDFITYMNSHRDMDYTIIKPALVNVLREIEYANKKGKSSIIFPIIEYSDMSLNYTDTLNYGGALMLSNPTSEGNSTFKALKEMNLYDIKRYLSLTKTDGSNYFLSNVYNIGETNVNKVVDAVNDYTRQVERQRKGVIYKDINVFKYNYMEKEQIARSKYAEIISYLLLNSSSFVFGTLNDKQRKLLLSSVVNDKNIDYTIREDMITYISDYLTKKELEELSYGKHNSLKRFIKSEK